MPCLVNTIVALSLSLSLSHPWHYHICQLKFSLTMLVFGLWSGRFHEPTSLHEMGPVSGQKKFYILMPNSAGYCLTWVCVPQSLCVSAYVNVVASVPFTFSLIALNRQINCRCSNHSFSGRIYLNFQKCW